MMRTYSGSAEGRTRNPPANARIAPGPRSVHGPRVRHRAL